MRYSIVIPVFNAERYLNDCIFSVRCQKSNDWELILVDDGSTDNSGSIVDEWSKRDNRIRAIHQENLGQFYARQEGIISSKGEYILFLDSDDRWEENCLLILDEIINKEHPDMILFSGRVYNNGIKTTQIIGQILPQSCLISSLELKERLLFSHELNSLCFKAFRRELFEGDQEKYEAFKGEHWGEDKVRLLKPATSAKIIRYIPTVLYQYHRREDSVIHSLSSEKVEQMLANDMFHVLRRYLTIWRMNSSFYRNRLDAYYLRNYLSVHYTVRRTDGMRWKQKKEERVPWRKIVDYSAFHISSVCMLSIRDRLRLFFAVLKL